MKDLKKKTKFYHFFAKNPQAGPTTPNFSPWSLVWEIWCLHRL